MQYSPELIWHLQHDSNSQLLDYKADGLDIMPIRYCLSFILDCSFWLIGGSAHVNLVFHENNVKQKRTAKLSNSLVKEYILGYTTPSLLWIEYSARSYKNQIRASTKYTNKLFLGFLLLTKADAKILECDVFVCISQQIHCALSNNCTIYTCTVAEIL